MKIILFLFPIFLFSQVGFTQSGKASYYNDRFQGLKTSSGEKYDMNSYTAAHRDLPFQTKVKVTNLKNNKSIIARVNDRGPFSHSRIVDLSKIAAKEIGMIEDGVVNVKLEVVEETTDKQPAAKNSTSVTSTVKPNKTEHKEEASVKDTNKKDTSAKVEIKKETITKVETKTTDISKIVSNTDSIKTEMLVDLKNATTEIFKTGHIYNVTDGMILNPKGFGIQVGYFTHIFNAMKYSKELSEIGFIKLFIKAQKENNKDIYRVFIGEYETELDAIPEIQKLKEKNIDYLVKRYDENKDTP